MQNEKESMSKKGWIENLISYCKKLNIAEFKELKKKDEYGSDFFESLRNHCQLFSVYVKKENLCLLLVVHDITQKTGEVSFFEADSMNELEFLLIKQILNQPHFQKSKKNCISYISEIYEILEKNDFSTEKMIYHASFKIFDYGYVILLSGKCFSFTPDLFIQCFIDELVKDNEQSHQRYSKYAGKIGTAIGGLCCPPFIVSDVTVLPFKQRIALLDYKGLKVLLFNNGEICVVVSDKENDYQEENRKKAVNILNEIVGTAHLHGLELTSFKENDLTFYFVMNENFDVYAEMYSIDHSHRSLLRQVSKCSVSEHKLKFLVEIKKDKIVEIIKEAEKITKSPEVRNFVLTYLDSFTHFYLKEYKTSFLLCWILFEKYIDLTWRNFLKENHVASKRIKKLTGIFWSADDIIESLNLSGLLSSERYSKLMKFKTLRNKIMHTNEEITKEKTKDALDLCKKIIVEIST